MKTLGFVGIVIIAIVLCVKLTLSNLVDKTSKMEYTKGDNTRSKEGTSFNNDSPENWDCYDVDLNNGVFWTD